MPNLQHVPCCLIGNPHPHLIYACSTSKNSTSPLDLLPLGGKQKTRRMTLVTREWVVCKIKFMNLSSMIHLNGWLWKLTNWMDGWMDGWMMGSFILCHLSFSTFSHGWKKWWSCTIDPFHYRPSMVSIIIIRLRKFTHFELILKHNHKNMDP